MWRVVGATDFFLNGARPDYQSDQQLGLWWSG
jgi:hypothetical protein